MADAPVLSGINRVADPASAGDFENKHTPKIVCAREDQRLNVSITMGHGVAHPNQADHFIEWIELLVDGAPVARFSFAAVAVEPTVSCALNVDAGSKVSALASCNLHGLWAYEVTAP